MAAKHSPGRESLIYEPSKVSWATAQFVRKSPSWTARAYIYFLIALIFAAFTYASNTQIAVFIESRGALYTEKSIFPIQVSNAFKVAKLGIKKGDSVRAGDVLIVSEDQLSAEDMQVLNRDSATVRSLLVRDRDGGCKACLSELKSFSENAFRIQNRGSFRDYTTSLSEIIREWATLREEKTKIGAATANLERQIHLAQQKLSRIHANHAESLLEPQVEQLKGDIVSAQAQIAERIQNSINQIHQITDRVDGKIGVLKPTVDLFQKQNMITAPVDGVVSELRISGVGQLVSPGQDLIEIVPAGSELVAKVKVANKDISKIRPGMETKIKLDALPEREYGTVVGRVLSVPPNTADASDPHANMDYEVMAALPSQFLVKDGKRLDFKLGMSLTALIVTKHESLLAVGIKKLLNLKDSVLDN